MIRDIPNPFRPTRWEHQESGYPLIWFTPTAHLLTEGKSTYVIGSRGSGKTTLLRSICWEDLLKNPSLNLQRSLNDFNYVGLYIRLPDHVAVSLGASNWQKIFPDAADPEDQYFRFFSLAVELVCLSKALTAIHELRVVDKITLTAGSELETVSTVLREFPEVLGVSELRPRTYLELARCFRGLVRLMNEATGRGTLKDLIPRLPKREPLELIQFALKAVSEATRFRPDRSGGPIGFKFCIDDCEVLSPPQFKTVNSLVRKSQFPISWVICSVGENLAIEETYIPNQPLTDADRRVLSLNERESKDFFSLCQAVSSLRLYFSIPERSRPRLTRSQLPRFFSLEDRLGKTSVNDLFSIAVSRSKSTIAKNLKAAAELLRDATQGKTKSNSEKALPFYETYLLWHWSGDQESFRSKPSESELPRVVDYAQELAKPAFQAWLRRKSVGALLHFLAATGFRRLQLHGADIIQSLSDGSIRDFLEVMAEIYEKHAQSRARRGPFTVEGFAKSRTKMSAGVQADGIQEASDSFFRGVSSQRDSNPEGMSRLIESLGKLTSRLQMNADDVSTLSTVERGVFLISRNTADRDGRGELFIRELLARAELSGYVRQVVISRKLPTLADSKNPDKLVGYRLHRRFAPHFLFSYRGAYELVRLTDNALAEVCASSPTKSVDEWVKEQFDADSRVVIGQLAFDWEVKRVAE